jgi:hypothetical protein
VPKIELWRELLKMLDLHKHHEKFSCAIQQNLVNHMSKGYSLGSMHDSSILMDRHLQMVLRTSFALNSSQR